MKQTLPMQRLDFLKNQINQISVSLMKMNIEFNELEKSIRQREIDKEEWDSHAGDAMIGDYIGNYSDIRG